MNRILPVLILSQLVCGQEILQHFDLDKSNHYVGTTTYEFELNKRASWTLNIYDIKGDIFFMGEPGDIIQITEEVSIWSSSGFKAKSLFDDYHAQVRQLENAGVIEIIGLGEWKARSSFEYTIVLPINCNISARTGGGDIEAERITGEISLSTSGGDLDLVYLTGKVDARTSGGDVSVDHCEGILALNTSGGDIDIEQVAGEVTAKTAGGDIVVESVQGNVNVQTSGGELSFEDIVGSKLTGITSGGSIEATRIQADMDVITSGGDIQIEDLAGSLAAETSGGDIDLEEIYGNADLSTSSGDITVTGLRGAIWAKTNAGDLEIEKIWDRKINEHDIHIINSHGSIYLVLPDDFPAQIDAVVEDEISASAIDSDFPIEVVKKYDKIRGESILGAGTYTVKLRTSHGTITIERGSD